MQLHRGQNNHLFFAVHALQIKCNILNLVWLSQLHVLLMFTVIPSFCVRHFQCNNPGSRKDLASTDYYKQPDHNNTLYAIPPYLQCNVRLLKITRITHFKLVKFLSQKEFKEWL